MSKFIENFKRLNLNGKIEALEKISLSELETNIEEILNILPHEHWLVRSKLIEKLSKLSEDKILPVLVSFLKPGSELSNLRNAAMEVLVRLGRKSIPYLLELLNNPSPDIRLYGVVTLGEIQDISTLEYLKKMAYDPDENVAQAAIEAIGKIHSPEVVDFLISLLDEDFWLQYPAVMALGKLRDPAAVVHLKKLMKDEMLKFAVIEALGNIGSDESIKIILDTLYREKDIVTIQELLKALVKIIDRDALHDLEKSRLLTDQNLLKLGKRKEFQEAVFTLVNSNDPDEKNAGIKLCGLFKLNGCVETLIKFLENDFFQEVSYEALRKYPSRIIEDIKKVINHPNKFVRRYIVKLLTEKGIPIDDIIDFMTDPESLVRSELANQLLLYGKEAVPYLFEMLNDPEESVRNTAFVHLLSYEAEDIKPYLIKIVKNRMYFFDNLHYLISLSSEFHIEEVLEDFEEIFNTTDDRKLKIDLLKAIIDIDRKKGLRHLASILNYLTKEELLRLLSSLTGKINDDYLKFLVSLLKTDDDEIKFNTYLVIASIKSEKSLEILIEGLIKEDLPLKIVLLSFISGLDNRLLESYIEKLLSIVYDLLKINNFDLQREIIKLYGKLYRNQESLNIVKRYLNSPHWSVRYQSLLYLKELDKIEDNSGEIYTILLNLLRDENDPLVFETLLEVLKEKEIKGSLDVLSERLSDLPVTLQEIASKYLPYLAVKDYKYVIEHTKVLPFSLRKMIEERIGTTKNNMDGVTNG